MTTISGRYSIGSDRLEVRGGRLVCRAFDLLAQRYVALKGAFGPPGGPSVTEIEEEYLRLLRFHHPSIVPVLDLEWHIPQAGTSSIMELIGSGTSIPSPSADTPMRFFTQPWVEAPSLRKLGRLMPSEVTQCLREMLEVVAFLHHRRLHRLDLKPDHFLRTTRGWCLIDLDQARPDRLLDAPELYGTLGYVAPEVLRGHPSGPREDLYSLGAIALEALTGRPLRIEGQIPEQWADWLEFHVPQLAQACPDNDAGLADLVRCLLAIDPLERPTAEESLTRLGQPSGAWRKAVTDVRLPLVGRETLLERANNALATCDAQHGGALRIVGRHRSGRSRFCRDLAERWQLAGRSVLHLAVSQTPRPSLHLFTFASRWLEQRANLSDFSLRPAISPESGDWHELRETRILGALERLIRAGRAASSKEGRPAVLLVDAPDSLDELSTIALSRLGPHLAGTGLMLVTIEAEPPLEANTSSTKMVSSRNSPPQTGHEAENQQLEELEAVQVRFLAEDLLGPGSVTGEEICSLLKLTEGQAGWICEILVRRWRDATSPGNWQSTLSDELTPQGVLSLPAKLLSEATTLLEEPTLAVLSNGEHVSPNVPGDSYSLTTNDLCLRAAESLEPRVLFTGLDATELLIGLFLAAGQPARARPYLQRLIEICERDLSLERAAYFLGLLINTWPKGAPPRAELLVRLAELEYELGHFQQSAEMLEQVLAHELAGNARAKAQAARGRALAVTQRYVEATELLMAVIETPWHSATSQHDRIKCLHTLAWVYLRTSQLELAEQALCTARGLSIPAGTRLEVEQLRYEAWHGLLAGRPLDVLQQSIVHGIQLAADLGYAEGSMVLLQLQAEVYCQNGDARSAQLSSRAYVAMCRQRFDSTREASGEVNLGRYARESGDEDDAIEHFERAAMLYRRLRTPLGEARSLLSTIDILLERPALIRRAKELIQQLSELLTGADPQSDGTLAWYTLVCARLNLREGKLDGLEPIFHRARVALEAVKQEALALMAVADLMELALQQDTPDPMHAWHLSAEVASRSGRVRDRVAWSRLHGLSARAHQLLTPLQAAEPDSPTEANGRHQTTDHYQDIQGNGTSRLVDLLLLQECCKAAGENEEALAAGLARLVGEHFSGRGLVWLKTDDSFEVLRGHRFPTKQADAVSQSIMREVALTKLPLVFPDLRSDQVLSRFESLRASRAGSLLCWPILHREMCVGVLYIDRRESSTSDIESAAKVLEHVARLAGDLLAGLLQSRYSGKAHSPAFEGLIGESPPMQALRDQMARVIRAQSRVIFLDGESGTGKTYVASMLHRFGRRAAGPFIDVNLVQGPESLVDDKLFGHVKGAFTGADREQIGALEAADGGTVFIDEVADLPLSVQLKLLKTVDEMLLTRTGDHRARKVDFALISATNKHLTDEVADGRFREDFFYRVHKNHIFIPPLRVRGAEDIEALALHFLRQVPGLVSAGRHIRLMDFFARDAADWLLFRYSWPGNVRQMKGLFTDNAEVETRLLDGMRIERSLLEQILSSTPLKHSNELPTTGMTLYQLDEWFQGVRKRYVDREVEVNDGNVAATARQMACDRITLLKIRNGVDRKKGQRKPRK